MGVPSEDNTSSQLKVYVSTGCVILPAFIAAWYYYSKKACRRVVVGFLKNEPCTESDNTSVGDSDFAMMEEIFDEQYHQNLHEQQRDDVDNFSSTELTNRLVKWINRQNVFTDYAYKEYKLEKRTKENLFGGINSSVMPTSPTIANKSYDHDGTSATIASAAQKRLVVDTTSNAAAAVDQNRLFYDEERDDSSLFWECIPNPDQGQFDFCSPKSALSSDVEECTVISHSSIISLSNNENKFAKSMQPNDEVIV
eukprot:jgi/Psemu1/29492/gm1.29492_g